MNKTEEMAIYIDNSMKEGTSMWFRSVSLADQLLGQLSSLRDRTIFWSTFLIFFCPDFFENWSPSNQRLDKKIKRVGRLKKKTIGWPRD